ncbi:MAG: acetamidase/formamidase family protein, partial [Bryobacteraceae bacterium]
NLTGDWAITVDDFGRPSTTRMVLKQEGEKLSGRIGGQTLEGSVNGAEVTFKSGGRSAAGKLANGEIAGEVKQGDRTTTWKAARIPARPAQARTHTFEPAKFELYFTSAVKPVLHIAPGDTVKTWSVDAGGTDPKGQRRSPGGNPQTGPFYVDGAFPGDTLVVKLKRIRTNRDWAGSGNRVMANAVEPWSLSDLKYTPGFNSRWKIDKERNVAYLEKPTDKLKDFSVPLRPMLGCVAVAPNGDNSVRTTDSGRFGGNMDYNQIVEGTTLYLPVSHPGALLFVGDGHAAQGDGELTGDALETSMDIEFSVDLISGRNFGHPLAENSEFLMSIGIGGSLDQALQMATSGMMRWLERDYKLSASEAAIVVGFAMKYDVADLVGTQVSITAKLPKALLAKLQKVSE